MKALDLKNKTVLVRLDLNVPIESGKITSTKRISASLPTIKAIQAQGARKIIIMSHLGRPKEGQFSEEFSLKPVADYLSTQLDATVTLSKSPKELSDSTITLLENVRFNKGEKENQSDLAKQLASLCDVFIMDAFGTAHRKQASTYGVAQFAPQSALGLLMDQEVTALTKALNNPQKPYLAIVGGSKVSSKLSILQSLADEVDQLIVGGGIANTFLAAIGKKIGKSLHEPDLIQIAKQILQKTQIPLPTDVVCATEFSPEAAAIIKSIDEVSDDDLILDIGPDTRAEYAKIVNNAKTIIWNGPVGVFEFDQFADGTKALTQAIAQSAAYSLAGGGDTIAAIEKFNATDKVSYISTGGGAFLEFIEHKSLPAIDIITKKDKAAA